MRKIDDTASNEMILKARIAELETLVASFEAEKKNMADFRKDYALFRLLSTDGMTEDEARQYAVEHDIDLPTDYNSVIAIEIMDYLPLFFKDDHVPSKEDYRTVRTLMDNYLNEVLGTKYTVYFPEYSSKLHCLVNIPDIDKLSFDHAGRKTADHIKHLMQEMVDHFEHKIGVYLIIAVSSIARGISMIARTVEEVDGICDQASLLNSDNRVFSYYDLNFDTKRRPLVISSRLQLERNFIDSLCSNDLISAGTIFNSLIDKESQNALAIITLKSRLSHRIDWLVSILEIAWDNSAREYFDKPMFIATLNAAKSVVEIKELCTLMFSALHSFLNGDHAKLEGNLEKIVSFIEDNYSNPNFGVAMICDYFGISISYLSRMFKNKTGVRIIDYIQTKRIVIAKQLLRETSVNVAEIAQKVGYYNSLALYRAFKRNEGITPGTFREMSRMKT